MNAPTYILSRAKNRRRTRTGLIHYAYTGRHRSLCGTQLPVHSTGCGPDDVATCPRCIRLAGSRSAEEAVPDGTSHPWVEDLDGRWHLRPTDDPWVTSMDEPNARTVCGLSVHSVHVSQIEPQEGDVVCPACEVRPISPSVSKRSKPASRPADAKGQEP